MFNHIDLLLALVDEGRAELGWDKVYDVRPHPSAECVIQMFSTSPYNFDGVMPSGSTQLAPGLKVWFYDLETSRPEFYEEAVFTALPKVLRDERWTGDVSREFLEHVVHHSTVDVHVRERLDGESPTLYTEDYYRLPHDALGVSSYLVLGQALELITEFGVGTGSDLYTRKFSSTFSAVFPTFVPFSKVKGSFSYLYPSMLTNIPLLKEGIIDFSESMPDAVLGMVEFALTHSENANEVKEALL